MKKTLSGSLSEWQTVCIRIRTDVQTVCKGYMQTTEVAADKGRGTEYNNLLGNDECI